MDPTTPVVPPNDSVYHPVFSATRAIDFDTLVKARMSSASKKSGKQPEEAASSQTMKDGEESAFRIGRDGVKIATTSRQSEIYLLTEHMASLAQMVETINAESSDLRTRLQALTASSPTNGEQSASSLSLGVPSVKETAPQNTTLPSSTVNTNLTPPGILNVNPTATRAVPPPVSVVVEKIPTYPRTDNLPHLQLKDLTPLKYQVWLRSLKERFQIWETNHNKTLPFLIQTLLMKQALAEDSRNRFERFLDQQKEFPSFAAQMDAFQHSLLPQDQSRIDRDNLTDFTQSGLTLRAYVDQFNDLKAKVADCTTIEAKYRFISGLSPAVKLDVDKHFAYKSFSEWGYEEVQQYCLNTLCRVPTLSGVWDPKVKSTSLNAVNSEELEELNAVGTDACFACGETGHYARDCKRRTAFPSNTKGPLGSLSFKRPDVLPPGVTQVNHHKQPGFRPDFSKQTPGNPEDRRYNLRPRANRTERNTRLLNAIQQALEGVSSESSESEDVSPPVSPLCRSEPADDRSKN